MNTEIKWKRMAGQTIKAQVDDIDLVIWATQFGTFTSTRRYEWRVERAGKMLTGGAETSQRYAKEMVVRELPRFLTRRVA